MIIKRKYEQIGVLIERDKSSRDLFYSVLEKQYDNETEIKEHISSISNVFIYLADMGVGIKNWSLILKGLEELDERQPYDNGLTYSDVSYVRNVSSSRKGNAIELWLICKHAECSPRIVDIIAVETRNNETKIIEPWEVNYLLD